MIGVLLRKDPAIRTLPPLAIGGGLLGALAAITVSKLIGQRDAEVWKGIAGTLAITPLIQALLVSWIAAIGGWAGVRARVGEMQLTLPVPLHTLIALRLVALLLVGWLPIAIAAAAVLIGVSQPEMHQVILRASGASALAWAAWVTACFAWRPGRPRLDSLPAFLAITAAGLALGWTSLLAPATGAPIALVVLAGAGIAIWRGLPETMEIGGAPAKGERAEERGSRGKSVLSAERSLRSWIARHTCLLGRNAILLVAIAFGAFINVGDDSPIPVQLFFITFFAGMVVMHSTRVLREVGHLPIGRKRLAAWVLLPPLLAMLLGTAGAFVGRALDPGTHWAQEVDLFTRRVSTEAGEVKQQYVRVPGSLMRPMLAPALGDATLVVTAPWGESATLHAARLVPGLPFAFANPYDITPESSVDFVAWQLARAVRDAYGVEIEPDELRERYLSVLKGRVIGPYFGQKFLEHHPEVDRIAQPGLVGWALMVVAAVWLLAGWWGTRPNVPAPSRGGWERARWRTYGLQFAGILAFVVVAFGSTRLDRRITSIGDSLAAGLVGAVGGNEWVVPALCLVALALGYTWFVRRFERMEAPPPLQRTWYQAPE